MKHFSEEQVAQLKALNYRVDKNRIISSLDEEISVGVILLDDKYILTFYEEGEKSSFLKDQEFGSFDDMFYFLRTYHGIIPSN